MADQIYVNEDGSIRQLDLAPAPEFAQRIEALEQQNTAQSAKDAAQDAAISAAQKSADDAQSSADTAQTAADAAQSSADAAQSSADAAQSSADALMGLLSGKADVGLDNVTEKGKASAVSWVMPDYNSIMTLPTPSASESTWTASADGFVAVCVYGIAGQNGALVINGMDVLRTNSIHVNLLAPGNGTFPVSKGDVIKYKTASLDATHYPVFALFIPAKGA